MFHRVLPDPRASYDPEMGDSNDLFESFLQWATEKFQIVAVPELMRRIKGTHQRQQAILRPSPFDDGCRTITKRVPLWCGAYKAPATIFLAARLIGSDRRFWQERLWAVCRNQAN